MIHFAQLYSYLYIFCQKAGLLQNISVEYEDFMGTRGLLQIFRLNSPEVSMIWQETVCLFLFCSIIFISIHILSKSGTPTKYFGWVRRFLGNLFVNSFKKNIVSEYLLKLFINMNWEKNFYYSLFSHSWSTWLCGTKPTLSISGEIHDQII